MPRRILEGQIVSDKQDKTVTVLVERRFMHPVYKKYVRRTDKYAAHDEANAFKIGQRVQIQECRPISSRKTWRVITGDEAPQKEKDGAGGTAGQKTESKKAGSAGKTKSTGKSTAKSTAKSQSANNSGAAATKTKSSSSAKSTASKSGSGSKSSTAKSKSSSTGKSTAKKTTGAKKS